LKLFRSTACSMLQLSAWLKRRNFTQQRG